MSLVSLDRRYAKALFDLASGKGREDAWLVQVGAVVSALSQVPGLRAVLMNRFFDLGKRKKIVDGLGKSLSLDSEVAAFVKLLIDKKRLGEIEGIATLFEEAVDHALGRLQVEVRSVKPLEAGLVEELSGFLAAATRKTPKLLSRLDPRLIGGVQLAWAGKLYDGSVRGELDALHRRLVTRS